MEEDKRKNDECIQVVVRCRPLSKKEKDEKRSPIIDIDGETRQVCIKNPDNPSDVPKSFTFDGAFDESTQQKYFYEEACFSLIESVLEGFNGTIFAYGQTGCGKSWTMQGLMSPSDLKGVIPNSFSHIFDFVKSTKDVQFLIRCSYLEIYNEEIKDLLGGAKKDKDAKCDIREEPNKGVYVRNLTNVVVESSEDLMAQLDKGLTYRTVASTLMNSESSRSHSIFSIVVEMSTRDASTGKELVRAGKLNLVDLAGSERQKKTGASGAQLKEGANINLSLSVLGNVISSLAEGKGKHVPYRESKLTRLLQDSLGGNTKTLMVAAISPADYNYDETLSTLRYANRAKNIKNKPKINEDPKDTMIREFKEEIERLKKMLQDQMSMGPIAMPAVASMPTIEDVKKTSNDSDNSNAALLTTANRHSEQFEDYSEIYDEEESSQIKVQQASDVSQALEAERLAANEKIKEKESEIENERKMREELMERLGQLQSKLVGDSEQKKESDQDVSERLEAEKLYKERRAKARKQREHRYAAEMQKVLEEKKAMEDELEELRENAANANSPTADVEALEKKMSRMKKKYEKKVSSVKTELEETKEEFECQRQQMMETMHEQERMMKLYQVICENVFSDKDLKKLLDKCRYDENEENWSIPFVKQKSLDQFTGGGNLPFLPDISKSNNPETSRDKGLSHLPSGIMSNHAQFASTMVLTSQDSGLPPRRARNSQEEHNAVSSTPRVPGLNLQTNLSCDNIAVGSSRVPGLQLHDITGSCSTRVETNEAPKKKKKSEGKKKKKTKSDDNKSKKSLENLPDEAGGGEYAGPLTDWGFAEEGIITNAAPSKPNDDYDDDEFEDDDGDNDENECVQKADLNNKNGIAFNVHPPKQSMDPNNINYRKKHVNENHQVLVSSSMVSHHSMWQSSEDVDDMYNYKTSLVAKSARQVLEPTNTNINNNKKTTPRIALSSLPQL